MLTLYFAARADHLLALDPESDMRSAFECFDDGDTGTIPAAELRKWLGEVGDRMSDQEVCLMSQARRFHADRKRHHAD